MPPAAAAVVEVWAEPCDHQHQPTTRPLNPQAQWVASYDAIPNPLAGPSSSTSAEAA
jgi:hypothetical protein